MESDLLSIKFENEVVEKGCKGTATNHECTVCGLRTPVKSNLAKGRSPLRMLFSMKLCDLFS